MCSARVGTQHNPPAAGLHQVWPASAPSSGAPRPPPSLEGQLCRPAPKGFLTTATTLQELSGLTMDFDCHSLSLYFTYPGTATASIFADDTVLPTPAGRSGNELSENALHLPWALPLPLRLPRITQPLPSPPWPHEERREALRQYVHTHTHTQSCKQTQPTPTLPCLLSPCCPQPCVCWPGARCAAKGGCWGTAARCWRLPQCQGAELGPGGSAAAQSTWPGAQACPCYPVGQAGGASPALTTLPSVLSCRAAPGSAAKAAPSPRNPRPTSLPTTATAGAPTEAGPSAPLASGRESQCPR